jgi:hypothetical protein
MNLQEDDVRRNQIIDLFVKLIEINNVFYGFITDYTNKQLYDELYNYETKVPKCIFWINYLGEEIIDRLPHKGETINNIQDDVYELEQLEKGYFIRLAETSVFDDEEKVALQKRICKEMGLD